MGTSITLPGGKAFDGTDYNYVYGDKDPVANGVELQAALTKAGQDAYTNGRRQTVMVGPGTYSPGELGSNFVFDPNRVSLLSLTGETDVKISNNGYGRVLANNSNGSGNILDLTPGLNTQIYNAAQEIHAGGSISLCLNKRCKSDYITLSDNSVILYNESYSNQCFVKVTDTSYTIGPNLLNSFPGFQIDRYWVITVPATGLREIYIVGYWNTINQRVFFKINTETLEYDPSFSPVFCDGGIEDIAICNNGTIIVVGGFNVLNSYPAVNIGKIMPDGFLDTGWNTGSGFDSYLTTVIYDDSTSTIYCGGTFTTYNGNSSPYFAIIEESSANWQDSAEYPNSAVYALKKFVGDTRIYAFGPFSQWGATSITGNNAVLAQTGLAISVLWNESPNSFYEETAISATIDSPTDKVLRFVNNNNATTINGTSVAVRSLIEYNISAGQVTSYSTKPVATNPYSTAYEALYSTNNPYKFIGWGYFGFSGIKVLLAKNLNNVEYQSNDYTLQGVDIDGTLVISSTFGSRFKINKSKIYGITDSASYANVFQNINFQLIVDNSTINVITLATRMLFNNSNVTSEIKVSDAQKAIGFQAFIGLTIINNSYVVNAYNDGAPLYVQYLQISNSQLNQSFNDGYKGASSNNYLDLQQCIVQKSYISESFKRSKPPRLFAENSKFEGSFTMDYIPMDVDLQVVLKSRVEIYAELKNITGYNYFYYDFTALRDEDLTNQFFGNLVIKATDCVSLTGYSLSFQNIPANTISNTYFNNCHVYTSPYDFLTYALSISIMPDLYNGPYALQNAISNVSFTNCSVGNSLYAFVLGVIVKTAGVPVGVSDVLIKNSIHKSSNNQGSSFNVVIQKDFPDLIPLLILNNINIQDSQIIANSGNGGFLSNFDGIQDLFLANISFVNSHVRTYTTSSNYAFLSYLVATNIITQGEIIFKDCSVITGGYQDNVPLPTANGFLSNAYSGTFVAENGNNLIFINCICDQGFLDITYSGRAGSVSIFAKDCTANYGQSFGKSITSLAGKIINCEGGIGSFGEAYFNGADYIANHQYCLFMRCSGSLSFGLDVAGSNQIYNGGKLYHYTTISGANPFGVNWTDAAFNI